MGGTPGHRPKRAQIGRTLTKDPPPPAALPRAPIPAVPTFQKRKTTHILQEQSRTVQAKRLSTKAASPFPSPFPQVAPARARSPTPKFSDFDSPQPLAYPPKVRTRRCDQRRRRACAHQSPLEVTRLGKRCARDASMPVFAPQEASTQLPWKALQESDLIRGGSHEIWQVPRPRANSPRQP